jgi:Flp pilus assembly protein TadG
MRNSKLQNMNGLITPRNSRRQGSVVFMEFFLLAPVLLLMALSVIQYGLIVRATTLVTNISREGARFAATSEKKSDEEIKEYVEQITKDAGLIPQNAELGGNTLVLTISPTENTPTRKVGEPITITVQYNMSPRIFLPGTSYLFGGMRSSSGADPIYRAKSTMRILAS